MKRLISIAVVAFLLGIVAPLDHGSVSVRPATAADDGAGGMGKIQIMLRKLQDAMVSMKDFDKLEKSGMPKKQVDRMRRAMQIKINQMMEETIQDIHKL